MVAYQGIKGVKLTPVTPSAECWYRGIEVEIPPGGDWTELKKLVIFHSPPKTKPNLSQLSIITKARIATMGAHETDVAKAKRRVGSGQVAVFLKQGLQKQLDLRDKLYGPNTPKAPWPFLRYRPIPPCGWDLYLPMLFLSPSEQPAWLRGQKIGLCRICQSYFVQRDQLHTYCSYRCRMMSRRKGYKEDSR